MPKNKKPKRALPHKTAVEYYAKNTRKIPFPQEYKEAARALKDVLIHKKNLDFRVKKVYSNRDIYRLAFIAISHIKEIDYLLNELQICQENPSLNHWELKIILAEMIWGKQHVKSNAAIVEAIKYYEESLREACLKLITVFPGSLDLVIPRLPTYVRINKLKISVEEALQLLVEEGWLLLPLCNTYSEYLHKVRSLGELQSCFIRDFHIPELLVFPPGTLFYNHRGYLNGKLLLQDKGSCMSSFLLNPSPGSIVLDLCAAPGFKTNHLANLMDNNGLLYANDIHPERFAVLSRLLGVTNVQCAQLSQTDIFDVQVPEVDYILVDASCTYSGIFSKTEPNGQIDRIKCYNDSLSSTLRHALQNFPTVKKVVYTTCSVFPSEGEQIVDDALKEFGSLYALVDLKELLGSNWVNQGFSKIVVNGTTTEYACGSKCLRTIPEHDLCQGYFIAIFERIWYVPVPPYVLRSNKRMDNSLNASVDENVSNNLTSVTDFTSDGVILENSPSAEHQHYTAYNGKSYENLIMPSGDSSKPESSNSVAGDENIPLGKTETNQQFAPEFFKLY